MLSVQVTLKINEFNELCNCQWCYSVQITNNCFLLHFSIDIIHTSITFDHLYSYSHWCIIFDCIIRDHLHECMLALNVFLNTWNITIRFIFLMKLTENMFSCLLFNTCFPINFAKCYRSVKNFWFDGTVHNFRVYLFFSNKT